MEEMDVLKINDDDDDDDEDTEQSQGKKSDVMR